MDPSSFRELHSTFGIGCHNQVIWNGGYRQTYLNVTSRSQRASIPCSPFNKAFYIPKLIASRSLHAIHPLRIHSSIGHSSAGHLDPGAPWYLISRGLVWVYMARDEDMNGYEVASIVACTRNTERVATITKVHTPNEWRGKGCAGRLVRHVYQE